MSRHRAVGGRGIPPPSTSTPKGFAPLVEGQDNEQEKFTMGDVMGMMRYFQRMFEVMINRLDRNEGRESVSNEGSQRPPVVSGSVHRELVKVKFPEFISSTNGLVVEAWLENMAMCFALRNYTSNMNFHMAVFQLKGSALLWWKTLLLQLNMAIEDVSWELFEEQF
jgi:hypothetical protein